MMEQLVHVEIMEIKQYQSIEISGKGVNLLMKKKKNTSDIGITKLIMQFN